MLVASVALISSAAAFTPPTQLLSRRTAVGLGAVAVVVGLLASYHGGTPASASIAVAAVLEFFVVLAVREIAELASNGRVRAAG